MTSPQNDCGKETHTPWVSGVTFQLFKTTIALVVLSLLIPALSELSWYYTDKLTNDYELVLCPYETEDAFVLPTWMQPYNNYITDDIFYKEAFRNALGLRYNLEYCKYIQETIVPYHETVDSAFIPIALFEREGFVHLFIYILIQVFAFTVQVARWNLFFAILQWILLTPLVTVVYTVFCINVVLRFLLYNTTLLTNFVYFNYLVNTVVVTTCFLFLSLYGLYNPVIATMIVFTMVFVFNINPVSSTYVHPDYVDIMDTPEEPSKFHQYIRHPFKLFIRDSTTQNTIFLICTASLIIIFLYHLINRKLLPASFDTKYLRTRVKEMKCNPSNHEPTKGHTHTHSAIQRANIDNYIKRVVPSRYLPYHVGVGNDPHAGIDMMFTNKSQHRAPWWSFLTQDIYIITAVQTLFRNTWLVFKNSDYYMDVTRFFWLCKPITIVTHDFTKLGNRLIDFSYSFNNNIITMEVLGGARYTHNVKRYDTDIIQTTTIINPLITQIIKTPLRWIGIELLFTYDVHYFTHDEYTIAHLTPRNIINTLYAPYTNSVGKSDTLMYNSYDTAIGNINAQVILEKNNDQLETNLYFSWPNLTNSYKISHDAFLQICAHIRNDPTYATANTVHTLRNVFEEDSAELYRVVCHALAPHERTLHDRKYITVTQSIFNTEPLQQEKHNPKDDKVDYFDKNSQPNLDQAPEINNPFTNTLTKNQQKENNSKWQAFMKTYGGDFSSYLRSPGQKQPENMKPTMNNIFPLLIKQPIYVPSKTTHNDGDAVKGRLIAVNKDTEKFRKNTKLDWTLLTNIIRYIYDVKLQPLTLEELQKHCSSIPNLRKRMQANDQAEKSAQTINTAGQGGNNFTKIELQMKSPEEAINRNISNDPDALVLHMTRYVNRLTEHAGTKIPGYAFKRTQKQLGEVIHALASEFDTVVETDYSSYDGTINTIIFAIECLIYQTAFPDHSKEIIDLKMQGYCATFKGTGYTYTTMGSRHSGAADTSAMNTLINVIITVYSRLTYNPKESIKDAIRKCVAGGDDGLAFDMNKQQAAHYENTAKHFGLILKAEIKPTNKPMNMLSRIYPNAKVSPGSGVDIKRMLCKLTHGSLKHTAINAIAMKVAGYITTDYNTPLVTEFLNEVIRTIQPLVDTKTIGKLSTSDEIGYTARLGQPHLIELPDEYILANDNEAVNAIKQATKQLKECITILEWKPTVYKPEDVGNYNNQNSLSHKPNKASEKLQACNDTGKDVKTMNQTQLFNIMNKTITDDLQEIFTKHNINKYSIYDMSPSPDDMLTFYQKLDPKAKIYNVKPTETHQTAITNPINKFLIYNPPKNMNKYNNNLFEFIKKYKDNNFLYINTTDNFIIKNDKWLKEHKLSHRKLGNFCSVISSVGKTIAKDPVIPNVNKQQPNKNSVMELPKLPEQLKKQIAEVTKGKNKKKAFDGKTPKSPPKTQDPIKNTDTNAAKDQPNSETKESTTTSTPSISTPKPSTTVSATPV